MSEPRRLHPASPLLSSVRTLPQVLVVAVVGGGIGPAALPFLGLLATAVVVSRYVAWWMFTYTVGPESIVVESGVLQRRRREVPHARIQQIDLRRTLRHRLVGLVAVRIDSAGTGEQAEVVLDAVDATEGERLQGLLRSMPEATTGSTGAPVTASAEPGGAVAPVAEPITPSTERILALGPGRLGLAGVTGRHLASLGAAVGFLWSAYAQLRWPTEVDPADWVGDPSLPPVAVVVALAVVVGVPLVLGLAAGASLLADGGYRLEVTGPVVRARRGLLDEREASIPLHRVQVVRIARNPLRRLLGYSSLSVHSAGASGPVDGSESHLTVPLVDVAEVDLVLGTVAPGTRLGVDLVPAPPAARRRARVRHLVPLAVLAVVAVVAAPTVWSIERAAVVAALLVATPLALARAEASYRALGWARVGDHVVARSGAFGHHVSVVPVARAQSTRLVSSPFQRRAGLATLAVDVAGRGPVPVVRDGDRAAMEQLARDALGATSGRRDEEEVRRRSAVVRAADVVPSGP